jgi:hypothetical protein
VLVSTSNFSISTMNSSLKIDSGGNLLTVYTAPATVTTEREIHKTVTGTKTFSRIRLLIRSTTEFVAALFAVFYLLAALALGGAVLFFTFWQRCN